MFLNLAFNAFASSLPTASFLSIDGGFTISGNASSRFISVTKSPTDLDTLKSDGGGGGKGRLGNGGVLGLGANILTTVGSAETGLVVPVITYKYFKGEMIELFFRLNQEETELVQILNLYIYIGAQIQYLSYDLSTLIQKLCHTCFII